MTLITDCLKNGKFNWSKSATKAFQEFKQKMVEAFVLRLPDFSKVFGVACDASKIGIGGVLSQKGHRAAYFSEKLNDAKLRYSTYDHEFYAVIWALIGVTIFSHKSVIFLDHETLKYINSQKKLNCKYGRCIEFL